MSRGEAVERIAMATASPRIPFTYRYGNVGWRSKLQRERQRKGALPEGEARGEKEGQGGGRKNRDGTLAGRVRRREIEKRRGRETYKEGSRRVREEGRVEHGGSGLCGRSR